MAQDVMANEPELPDKLLVTVIGKQGGLTVGGETYVAGDTVALPRATALMSPERQQQKYNEVLWVVGNHGLEDDQMYTVEEAAARLKVSETHLRRLIARGLLPVARIGTGVRAPVRIRSRDLRYWTRGYGTPEDKIEKALSPHKTWQQDSQYHSRSTNPPGQRSKLPPLPEEPQRQPNTEPAA